jgi:hypothetical protein
VEAEDESDLENCQITARAQEQISIHEFVEEPAKYCGPT